MTAEDWPATQRPGAPPFAASEQRPAADEVRLRDVIRRLLTPTWAGLFLGRDDLARLGAALGFPLPALDRRIMLEHLFVAAAPAGLLPRLLDLLGEEVDAWIAIYRGWETAYPHTAAIWAEWRARAEALRGELVDMRGLAQAVAESPSSPDAR
jgi:hypothetical protein